MARPGDAANPRVALAIRRGDGIELLLGACAAADRGGDRARLRRAVDGALHGRDLSGREDRSEEHTSELQSLMRISYAVFCLKKKRRNRLKPLELKTHQ